MKVLANYKYSKWQLVSILGQHWCLQIVLEDVFWNCHQIIIVVNMPDKLLNIQTNGTLNNERQNQVIVNIFAHEKWFCMCKKEKRYIQSHKWENNSVLKDNGTLMVKFTLEAWKIKHCNLELVVSHYIIYLWALLLIIYCSLRICIFISLQQIQPLSVESMKNCLDYREKVDICPCRLYTECLIVYGICFKIMQ